MNARTIMEIPSIRPAPREDGQRSADNRQRSCVPGEIHLRRREVMSFDLEAAATLRLEARDGAAWVTMEGDRTDHVLEPSAPLAFTGPGRVVVEAVAADGLRLRTARSRAAAVT